MAHVYSKNITRTVGMFAALAALAGCTNSEQDSTASGQPNPPKAAPSHSGHAGASSAPAAPSSSAGAEGRGEADHKVVELKTAQGAEAGTAEFTQTGDKVVIKIEAKALTPGFHGVHIHAVGKCEPSSTAPNGQGAPGAFLSSGAHYQVPGHAGMPMSGDLTNLLVLKDGSGSLTLETDSFQLSELSDGSGTSIIVHEKPSNFANIPADRYKSAKEGGQVPDEATINTEDAGGRAVCGVIAPAA